MKSKLLFVSVILMAGFSHSYASGPVISGNPWWVAGDVFTNQWVKVGAVSPGSSGASQTWDFSALVDSGAPESVYVVAPSSTPPADAAYFTSATLAALYTGGTGTDSTYEYFGASGGQNFNYGGVTDSSHTVFTTPIIQLQFPMAYGDSWAGPIAGTYTGSISGTITGWDSSWVDGYGTLIMPGQTYTNEALRVNTKWQQNISVGGFSFTINYQAYDYLIPGYTFFIFEIATTSTTFNGVTTTVSLALRAKNLPSGINMVSAGNDDLSIYPNPAKNNFTVRISDDELNSGATMQITDLLGQKVREQKLTANSQNVDLSEISKGMYVVNIQTPFGNTSRKLTVE